MESAKPKSMSLLVTKNLTQDIRPEFVRCCPTMDLVAIATRDERVEVFRLSGQRAFGIQRKLKDVQIKSVCWKYNGQYLAVSWSDGLVDVISTETGNALHNFRHGTDFGAGNQLHPDGQSRAVFCLGWGLSLLDGDAGRARTKPKDSHSNEKQSTKPPITLDDFLDREPDLEAIHLPSELPEQLSGFDATELMPKLPVLSILPAAAYKSSQPPLAELFASQTLLDSALHRGPSKALNALDTFLLSNSQGTLRMVLYDSLSIGNISPPGLDASSSVQYLKHYSHPFAHCHVLLTQIETASGEHCIALVPISLRFLKNAGRNIHFIDYKTAQLDTLVQYIGETILAVNYHWKHGQDLPSKFQANIEEDLMERNEPSLWQSLYQLAATGHCSEKMSEWLKDELAERGHKRWDASVSQAYVKLIEHVQENLLPALDRCSAILCNLQGLAQYYEQSPAFDVPISSFAVIQDIIRCIRNIGHHMLLFASEEQRRFASFSRWLRHQIDVQASDPTSAAGKELLEKEAGVDYPLVFSYIEKTLEKSRLEAFLCHPIDAPDISPKPDLYGTLRTALDGFKTDTEYDSNLLKLPSYHKEWCKHNQILIEQITSWQRANVIVPGALTLGSEKLDLYDMRMVADVSTNGLLHTYVATTTKKTNSEIKLFKLSHSELFDNVPGSLESCKGLVVKIPGCSIRGIQFGDDNTLFVLVELEKSSRLLCIPLDGTVSQGLQRGLVGIHSLAMRWATSSGPNVESKLELSVHDIAVYTKHEFTNDGQFIPKHFEINGRKDRRLCVMIAQNIRQFAAFDLDSSEPTRDRDSIGG